jgi:hypothetical protein
MAACRFEPARDVTVLKVRRDRIDVSPGVLPNLARSVVIDNRVGVPVEYQNCTRRCGEREEFRPITNLAKPDVRDARAEFTVNGQMVAVSLAAHETESQARF